MTPYLIVYETKYYTLGTSSRDKTFDYYIMEFLAKEGSIFLGNQKVSIKGINWFGFETEVYGLHGLWSVSMKQLLDFVKANKFNALRIPISEEVVFGLDTLKCTALSANPDMVGWTAGKLLDTLVVECAKRGILVMPDIHHFTGTGTITELWYSNEFPESKMIEAWKIIVKRYINSPNVFAIDIKNEPHGIATWATGNPATDWDLAATRIGNAILDVNPKLLIFVEGVEKYNNSGSWWGGTVEGAKLHPVTLKVPNKLVYSPHVYGPSVFVQDYFKTIDFPNNLPPIWTKDFAFLKFNKTGTICLGEWGGKYLSANKDDVWQNAMADFIAKNDIDYFYFSLCINSGDTCSIVLDDWTTPNQPILNLLEKASPNPSVFTLNASQISVLSPVIPKPTPVVPKHTPVTPKPTPVTPTAKSVSVTVKDTNQWTDGTSNFFQQDVTVQNNSTKTIPNVAVKVVLTNSTLEQSWNCVNTNNILSFPQWLVDNGGLKPNESAIFGIVVKGQKPTISLS